SAKLRLLLYFLNILIRFFSVLFSRFHGRACRFQNEAPVCCRSTYGSDNFLSAGPGSAVGGCVPCLLDSIAPVHHRYWACAVSAYSFHENPRFRNGGCTVLV